MHSHLHWGLLVGLAAVLALLAKLALSARTGGTIDVVYWQQFLAGINAGGGAGIYAHHELFNHPPFMIHFLRALGALQGWSGAPFVFLLRLPGIFADVGTVALVWALRERLAPTPVHPAAIVLLALAPASLMISGYHGNTDSLMIFFVVLGVFLAERYPASWPAGTALGMALCIKIAAAIFLPVFVLSRRRQRDKVTLLSAAAMTFVVASTPYLYGNAHLIARRVLGYAGGATPWGAPLLFDVVRQQALDALLANQPAVPLSSALWLYRVAGRAGAAYAAWSRPALLAALCLLAWWLNRPSRRLPLFTQCAITACLFLVFAPGFGVQYLAWVVPWVAAAGALVAAPFHLTSAALLYWLYRTDYFGAPTASGRSLLCWAAIGAVLAACLRYAAAGGRRRRGAPAMALAGAAALVAAALWSAPRPASDNDRPLVIASSTHAGSSPGAAVDGRSDPSEWPSDGWHSNGTPRPEAPEVLTFVFPHRRAIERIGLAAFPDPQLTLDSFVFQAASAAGWRDIDATRVAHNTVATSWTFTVPHLDTELVRLRIDGAADAYARVLEVQFSDGSD
ncbi:MAG: glycosyltransferase 87 family protein [bacterium]